MAALRIRDSILTSAETEGLTYQAYWLSTTLALGAFLKVLPSALLLEGQDKMRIPRTVNACCMVGHTWPLNPPTCHLSAAPQ